MTKQDNEGRSAIFCLGSSNSPITDTIKSIHRHNHNNDSLCFIGSRLSIDETLQNKNTLIINYKRNLLGVFQIMGALAKLARFIKSRNIGNILFFSTLPINGLVSLLIGKRVKCHWWLHDPIPHSGEKLLNIILKNVDEFILLNSAKVKSIFLASNFLQANLPEKYKSKRISVIPFPYVEEIVDATHPPPLSPSSDQADYDIVFFGRIEQYKGIEWFLEGLDKFGNQLKSRKILIAGKGHLNHDINALKSKGYLIDFRNHYVENHELKRHIESCKVCIFPYRDATGTQAPQTAGALGALVVATDVGSLPESSLQQYAFISGRDDQKAFIDNIVKSLNTDIDRRLISSEYRKSFSPDKFTKAIKSAMSKIN